jgi:hypothetical protein
LAARRLAVKGVEIEKCAEMVLVGVGEHDARETGTFLLEETDVREDEIDPRKIGPGEGNAEIDGDPCAVTRRTEAVEAKVHADFAHPP